jgi:glyoxylase-like metal-dependent hydrolase (beta-lactamase superfamily II)/rhodanese-related sulfurtransferase
VTLTVHGIRTEGLGDTTYILVYAGQAVVVDPQRDIDRFETVLNDTGADVRLVVETHVHNDYVSGGRDLARAAGAELVMPAAAAPVFRHRPAFHHEDIDLGEMVVRPIHTPGHTPEHTSYLIVIDGVERALFSGGSLLVGSAGRSDLLGDERADTLARLQYGSVNRLARLPDAVDLYPTHGSGSFCTTVGAGNVSSTIGDEKRTNPVLAYPDEDSFVAGQLAALVPYPSYYAYMGPINLTGLDAPLLEVPDLDAVPEDVTVVDARPQQDYAAGHLPGSLGVELRDSFGTWVGWITEHNTPIALIMNEDQDVGEAVRQLARIGYDDIRGVVRPSSLELTETYRLVDIATFAEAAADGAQVLDVRAPNEWPEGVIDGSVLCYVPDVAEETPAVLDTSSPLWVICGTGYRAQIAASLLQPRGFEPVVLGNGGTTDVLAAASKGA